MVNEKVSGLIVILCAIIFLMSFASAGFGDWFGRITGRATGVHNVSVAITGTSPVVVWVWNQTLVGVNVTPTANTVTGLYFVVTLTDPDGTSDINTTSVVANFTRTGESVRENLSCKQRTGETWSNSMNFSCTIDMMYYDENAAWRIIAGGRDLGNGTLITNSTKNFSYGSLSSIEISPPGISFGSVATGATNQTATTDPLQLNNTGNANFTNVSVLAIDLFGETLTTSFIGVANLSASNSSGGSCSGATCIECTGNSSHARTLVNGTAMQVYGGVLIRGNNSANNGITGQEQIYYCIRVVPPLPSQIYSSILGGNWTINTATT
jgi:hypothetical protein